MENKFTRNEVKTMNLAQACMAFLEMKHGEEYWNASLNPDGLNVRVKTDQGIAQVVYPFSEIIETLHRTAQA